MMCNVLLAIILVLLAVTDIEFCIVMSSSVLDGPFNFLFPLVGIMALLGAYHLLLNNRLGGLCMGLSSVLTLAEWFSFSEVTRHDMFDATELGTWEMFVKSLPLGLTLAAVMLVPILLILMIPKNGVPALFRLECKGVFFKLRYELLLELVIGVTFVLAHGWCDC